MMFSCYTLMIAIFVKKEGPIRSNQIFVVQIIHKYYRLEGAGEG